MTQALHLATDETSLIRVAGALASSSSFLGWLMQLYIAMGLVTCNSFAIPSAKFVAKIVMLRVLRQFLIT